MSGSTTQVTTELIVDARQAQQGVVAYVEAIKQAGTATADAGAKIDTAATSFSRSEKAANSYLARLDPVFFATQQLGKESTTLGTAISGLEQQFLRGAVTLDQYNSRQALLAGKMGELKAAQADLSAGTITASQAIDRVSGSTEKLGLTTGETNFILRTFATQSVGAFTALASGAPVISVLTSTFASLTTEMTLSRHGFSLMHDAFNDLVSAGGGLGGVALAVGVVAASIVVLGVVGEDAARKITTISNTLVATRADYAALTDVVVATGKAVAATTEATVKEATAAAAVIGAVSTFSGSQAALERLVTESVSLATIMGVTIPEAAKKWADAMKDPAAEAQKYADSHSFGFTQEIADQIKRMQDAGNTADAFALAERTLGLASDEAKLKHTALQTAVIDLGKAFLDSGNHGTTYAKSLGQSFADDLAIGIKALADFITKLGELDKASSSDRIKQLLGHTPGATFSPAQLLNGLFGSGGSNQVTMNAQGSGAMGLMQIMPSTAALTPGLDPTTLLGNIELGVIDLQRKLSAVGASPTGSGVSAANLNAAINNYGGGDASGAYALSVRQQDISKLNPSVSDAIERIAIEKGVADQAVITVLKQIALQESGGKQFSAAAQAGFSPTSLPGPSDLQSSAPALGGAGQIQAQVDSAIKFADSLGTITERMKALHDEADKLNTGIAAVGKQQADGTITTDQANEAYAKLQAGLNAVQGKINDTLTPEALLIRQFQESAAIQGQNGAAATQLAAAYQKIDDAARSSGDSSHVAADKQAAAAAILGGLNAQLTLYIDQTAKQIAANEGAADAASLGAKAESDYAIEVRASIDALKFGVEGSDAYNAAKKALIQTNTGLKQSQDNLKASEESFDLQHQIDMVKLETDTLGMDSDARAQLIVHMQAEYEIRKQLPNATEEDIQKLVAEKDALQQNQQILAQHQAGLNVFASAITDAFDTISQAVTQSLFNSGKAAINWGQVMAQVVQAVIQKFLTLAILNPILNSLGLSGGLGNLPTIFSALGALGGIGGGGGAAAGGVASGGGLTNIMNLLQLGSTANTVTGGGATGFFGNLAGTTGTFGESGSVANFLQTPLFGATALGTDAFAPASIATSGALGAEGFGAGGQLGVATAGDFTAAGGSIPITLGGALGIAGAAGAGFGVGSLSGSLIQGSLGKVGPAPEIGAAAGAISGAVIGSVVPVIGTLIGAIVGGLIGGSGGGLIGPQAPTAYSGTSYAITPAGRFNTTASASQIDKSNVASTQTDLATINVLLDKLGLVATSVGQFNQVGQQSNKGAPDPRKAPDIATAFPGFQFASPDQASGANIVLGGRSFANTQELATVAVSLTTLLNAAQGTGWQNLADYLTKLSNLGNTDLTTNLQAATVFITQTVPSLLTDQQQVSGSLADSVAKIHAAYDPAITTAHDLAYKEQELTDARQKALDVANQTAHDAVYGPSGILGTLQTQKNTADTALYGTANPDLSQAAALANFDVQAQAARDAMKSQIEGIYGTAFLSTQAFADLVTAQESTLADQRLAVIKQFADQVAAVDAQTAQSAAQAAANTKAVADSENQWYTAGLAAQAAMNPALAQASQLFAFDIQAQQQRDQFTTQVTAAFGDAFTSTSYYADEMARLEDSLGKQRLAIQQQYNDQLTQTATSTITSLASYAAGLQTGSASPLSPTAQYGLAKSQFQAVSGAASAGDFNSIGQLQSYSQAFLSASQTVFGSGAGYAADFQTVLNALNAVASLTPDTLTASVYTSEVRSQTQQLIDSQSGLAGLLSKLIAAVQQAQSAPARALAA